MAGLTTSMLIQWCTKYESVKKGFATASKLFTATYYWWDYDKATIKERIAFERFVIICAASELFSIEKMGMGSVAKYLDVKQPRLREWLKLFKTGGIEGLQPKKIA